MSVTLAVRCPVQYSIIIFSLSPNEGYHPMCRWVVRLLQVIVLLPDEQNPGHISGMTPWPIQRNAGTTTDVLEHSGDIVGSDQQNVRAVMRKTYKANGHKFTFIVHLDHLPSSPTTFLTISYLGVWIKVG